MRPTDIENIQGRQRDARSCQLRAVAAALLREQDWTLPEIGSLFDGRDKGTVFGLVQRGHRILQGMESGGIEAGARLRERALRALSAELTPPSPTREEESPPLPHSHEAPGMVHKVTITVEISFTAST
jgi:hypothetical protein